MRDLAPNPVEILELSAWGLDESPYRPAAQMRSDQPISSQPNRRLPGFPAILPGQTALLAPHLPPILNRPDLVAEFDHLHHSIAVIDLRALQAFQRRLAFDPIVPVPAIPDPDDTLALLDLAFPPPRSTAHTRLNGTTLRSLNPDLTLLPTRNGFELHGGSPFLEVARLTTAAGPRFFLRDGYHRAHRLLCAGIHAVPAILIEAATFSDIFPAGPWFFPEDVLLAPNAPLVTDFLSSTLTLRYSRPRLYKTITVTETLEPGALEPQS